MTATPALIHTVDQLAATIRDACDEARINVHDETIREAMLFVVLTCAEDKAAHTYLMLAAWASLLAES